jgi:hypothetical protein
MTASGRRARRARLYLGSAFAVAAVYGALLLAESFFTGPGCCLASWPNPNPVQTERLVDAADPDGRNGAAQARAARDVLAARPVDASGWMRLAHADALRNGRLSPEGLHALRTSYTMSAYAGRNVGWRVTFALNHWDELDADTRAQALQELEILANDGLRRDAAKPQLETVSNPVGRTYVEIFGLVPPQGAISGR